MKKKQILAKIADPMKNIFFMAVCCYFHRVSD